MKAILEFTLPDDDYAYQQAAHAATAFSILLSAKRAMRDRLKYSPVGSGKEERKALRTLYEQMLAEMPALPEELRD